MDGSMTGLLARVSRGDQDAAARLVETFSPMLQAMARRAGVPEHRVHDVVQTTWLRLFEAPSRVEDPERLAGWLRTVAMREAWRTVGSARREQACGDALSGLVSTVPGPEERVVCSEEVAWLRGAIDRLPPRQRLVMHELTLDPSPSYEEIAERTGIPVGSIGPTRARAVDRLRRLRQTEGTPESGLAPTAQRPARPARCARHTGALAVA